MPSSSDRLPTPGEILRGWQHGACELLQNLNRSAQHLHLLALHESSKAFQHIQEHHSRQPRHRARHAAFASVTASIFPRPGVKRSIDRARPTDKGLNCVIDSLADASTGVQPTKGPSTAAGSKEEKILFSEVNVKGVEGPLKDAIESVLTLKPNFSYTLNEVQNDMENIFRLGWFKTCQPHAEDTRDGIKLTVQVEANPQLKGVEADGANVLPTHVIEDAFQNQYDQTLNFKKLQAGLDKVNNWYSDRGIFGQVTHIAMEDDVARLKVAEMQINKINIQWEDRNTGEIKDEGKTKPDIILRHLTTKPGQVYNIRQAQRDIQAVQSMRIFDSVQILPRPSEGSTVEHPALDLTLQIVEPPSLGGFHAGCGMSLQGHTQVGMPGFTGEASYTQPNLFGLNQNVELKFALSQMDHTFVLSHTDPWLRGDPHRTSRTISLQSNQTSGNLIHAKAYDDGSSANQATGPDSNLKVARRVGAIEFGRPLYKHWNGSLGVNLHRASCRNDHNQIVTKDCYDAPLTFSGCQYDTMMLALIRGVYSGRNNTQVVLSMEQALPVLPMWLNFNRFRTRIERSFPLAKDPRFEAYLCGKGGTIIGDLPPYEAFPIGGTASVRGYSEGGVGTGRHFATGTAEVRFPISNVGKLASSSNWISQFPVEGTLFVDYGTDFDSGASILGDPAGLRGKPGNGYGYGAGMRIASPLGPLRLEYAWNKEGKSRWHLGMGAQG